MNKLILSIIIVILLSFLLCYCTLKKENYEIAGRGLRLNPLFVEVPKDVPVYKGYTMYSEDQLKAICPSAFNKDEKKICNTRDDCGDAEVCVKDGVSSYCQCSIMNDCIYSGVC